MKRTAEFMAATAAAVLLATQAPAGEVRKAEIPMVTRLAPVTNVNAETRVVTLTWTTGADVTRYDWWTGKRYIENLDVSDGACDLSRLNAGAPLLNSHSMWSLDSQLGVVERAWIENGEGKAEVRFPAEGIDPDADKIFRKVQDKIIRNVSVGYMVRKYQITDNQDEGLDVWRAVDWQPMEISLVTIPADVGAGVRSETDSLHACEFVRAAPASNTKQETEMKTETAPAPATAAANDEATRQATQAATQAAVETERKRVLAIQSKVRAAGLPDEVATDLIGRGVAEEHCGNHILDEMAKRGAQPPRPAGDAARVTQDEVDTRRSAIAEALLHRAQPTKFKLTDAGREWRGLRLDALARTLLEAEGRKVRGLAPMELAAMALNYGHHGRSAMTTSDFPSILANVADKALQAGYATEVRTFLPFCAPRTAADFKTLYSIQLGEGSNLELVNEKGEFKRGKIGEGKETYALATYGKVYAFTRQALINDDMDAFSRVPYLLGAASVRLENDIVWGIITTNGNMADGNALFHASHSNLTSGATSVINGVLGVQKMRSNLQTMKGLDSNQVLNLQLKYLLVPAALTTQAEQFMSPALYASQTANVVPEFYRALTPIVEGRLDANSTTAFYGSTDPSQMATIEYAYLEGQEGAVLETRNGFDVDGLEVKVRHDFAAKAVNSRGLQKSAGA